MGFLSHKIDRRQLNPGDHIYSWRQAYLYAHHGIYVGEGKVIHFTQSADQETGKGSGFGGFIISSSSSSFTSSSSSFSSSSSSSSSSSLHSLSTEIPCPTCGKQTRTSGVISSCLDCFLDGGDLYRFEYGVSFMIFHTRARGGTCTRAPSDPAEQVLQRARFLLEKGFGDYNVIKNNCEDFAFYCKTGILVSGQSGQVASCIAAVKTIAWSSPLLLLTTGLGVYCGQS